MYTNLAAAHLKKLTGLEGPQVVVPGVCYTELYKSRKERTSELLYEDVLQYGSAVETNSPYYTAYCMAAISLVHEVMEDKFPDVDFEVSTPNFILISVDTFYIGKLEEIRDAVYDHLYDQDMWVIPVATCCAGCVTCLRTETRRNTDDAMEGVFSFITEQTPLQLIQEMEDLELEYKSQVLTRAESSPKLTRLKTCVREPKANPKDIAGYWDPVDPFMDLCEDIPPEDRRIAAHYIKGCMYG